MECQDLQQVRQEIDRIDDEIIKKIAERTHYVLQASKFKKSEEGVKAPARVEQVIQKVRTKAETYGAPPDLVEAVYREMISQFINLEMDKFKKQQE